MESELSVLNGMSSVNHPTRTQSHPEEKAQRLSELEGLDDAKGMVPSNTARLTHILAHSDRGSMQRFKPDRAQG